MRACCSRNAARQDPKKPSVEMIVFETRLVRAIRQCRKHYLLDAVFLDRASGDPRILRLGLVRDQLAN